jgi:epoxyqueuosine reductase
MRSIPFETLKALAERAGLSVISVTTPDELAVEGQRLAAWQSAGYAADMTYMERPPALLATPKRLLESVKSIVVIAALYDRTPRAPLPAAHGRIARYAWGRDYHKVLRTRLSHLADLVNVHCGGVVEYRVFSDSVPLLERALSAKAGLSFIGKNTMAIMPGKGSFFFIGEVLWNVEIDGSAGGAGAKGRCGSCSNCLSLCPTNAFVSERTLDAGRCISYLTIEKRGVLTYQERSWIGDWLFGCDVCQEVCPFNIVPLKKGERAALPELSSEAGIGPSVSLEKVLSLRSDEAFRGVFQGTALMRTKREGMVRNAAVVAANTNSTALFDLLAVVAEEDPSPVVRRHALWAAAVIADREGGGLRPRVVAALERARKGGDGALEEECKGIAIQLPNLV